jgi:hypothetical protein
MDTTLVTVTVLSMGMAAAMSAIVWRMLRSERLRSSARVAALTALSTEAPAKPRVDIDLPMRESAAATLPAMFVERDPASPWGPRFAVMGAVGLIGTSVVLFTLAAHAQKAAPAHNAPAVNAAATAATASGGLELLSLRDSREPGNAAKSKPGGLTITGLVRNPRDGTALNRVTVTAFTFDANGAFLASGRALIDVTALAPGDESPFVVTVPVSDAVARYRIGFRDDAGRVIAHVDRRQQGPIAANW